MSSHQALANYLSFEYLSGGGQKRYPAHETGWRKRSYTVVVCAFEEYYFYEIQGERRVHVSHASVVIPSGSIHRVGAEGEASLSFAHVRCGFPGCGDLLSRLKAGHVDGNSHLRIAGYLESLGEGEKTQASLARLASWKAAGYSLLDELFRLEGNPPDGEKFRVGFGRILPVLTHIASHWDSIPRRKELATLLNLSETRFHVVFRDIMGTPPMSYVRDFRLEEARKRLETTGDTLEEIAGKTGFRDPFHFMRRFKIQYGVSPGRYRREFREGIPEVP